MPGEQILALERAADVAFDPLQRAEEHDPAVNIAGACPFVRYQIVQPGRMWRFLDSATPCRWLPKFVGTGRK